MGNRSYEINTIKELYARSGNQCAFPGCSNELFIDGNINLSQICHIYGLKPGSARYTSEISEEKLNKISNLILLCPYHHKMVDSQPEIYLPNTLISMKESHEAEISRSKEISFNIPRYETEIDLTKLKKWMDKNGYEFQEKHIRKAINKILIQHKNTRVTLAKIIEVYCNNGKINMREVLNELNCDEYQLAYQLQLLEDIKFIEEERYTGDSIESFIELEDGSLCDVSGNYVFKLNYGEWYLAKKGEIILMICEYIKSFNYFVDFIINGNISYIL